MIYFILLFLCIVAYLVSQKNKRLQKASALLMLFILMIIVGIRDTSVGVDSEQYASKIGYIKDITSDTYEPLFQLSINFVSTVWGSVLSWFLYLSIITYTLYSLSVVRYSVNPILSVLVFMVSTLHFFPDTMNNLRQGISIMLLLLSYLQVAHKKYIVAVVLFLIALGFHMSSLLVLPFYFLAFWNPKKMQIISILIITFIVGFISSSLFDVESLIPNLSVASEVFMEGLDKLSNYSDSERVLNWAGLITALTPLNLLCVLLIPGESDEKSYKYLFNFYFWGVVLGNLIFGTIPFGARYVVLFLIVESILFAYKYKRNKLLKPYLVLLVLMYCYYLVVIANRNEPGMIIPYTINPELYRLF